MCKELNVTNEDLTFSVAEIVKKKEVCVVVFFQQELILP